MNAADGSIRSRVATYSAGGGSRSLNAVLDNRGLLQVDEQLDWRNDSGQSANSGTIRVTAAHLTLNQTGTDPRFTNTGSIEVAIGTGFGINAGAVVQDGGTMARGRQALTLNSVNATLETDMTGGQVATTLNTTTVNGPGRLLNPAGGR